MDESEANVPTVEPEEGTDTPAGEGADVAPDITDDPAPMVVPVAVAAVPATPAVIPVADAPIPLAGPALGVAGGNLMQVVDEEVPLAVLDEEELPEVADETDGVQELTEVIDEEVPLVNTNLVEDVKHCILHFFEWILAAILSVYYVANTKKQKKEIAELKNGLEHEDEKRG